MYKMLMTLGITMVILVGLFTVGYFFMSSSRETYHWDDLVPAVSGLLKHKIF